MSVAGYLVKERVEALTAPIVSPDVMALTPGRGADQEDAVFGTYTIVQNRLYNQPYRHSDLIDINIFHPNFDIIQQCVSAIVDDLNQENFGGHAINSNSDDIRFTNITATQSSASENTLINGKEAHGARLAILIEYVEL